MMQWLAMALSTTLVLRLALAERARVAAELVRVPVEDGHARR